MKKVKSFRITWNNNLRYKDKIEDDPFYHSPTGMREVVSMGKTMSYRIEFEDGEIIENIE